MLEDPNMGSMVPRFPKKVRSPSKFVPAIWPILSTCYACYSLEISNNIHQDTGDKMAKVSLWQEKNGKKSWVENLIWVWRQNEHANMGYSCQPWCLLSGLSHCPVPCSPAQLSGSRAHVSCHGHGCDPNTKAKVFSCWCGSLLTHKHQQADFTKILATSSDQDLRSAALNQQTVVTGTINWFHRCTTAYIFQMPDVQDGSYRYGLMHHADCHVINLLTGYCSVPLATVCSYMECINLYGCDVDLKTSEWVQVKLEKSIETNLLQQVKQNFLSLPEVQRSSVVLWKLIFDALESCSFEYTQELQNYMTSFDVRATDGEIFFCWPYLFQGCSLWSCFAWCPSQSHPPSIIFLRVWARLLMKSSTLCASRKLVLSRVQCIDSKLGTSLFMPSLPRLPPACHISTFHSVF